MDVRIRRGERTDADFLAWVMLASSRSHLSRGIWDALIGADEAGCLEYLRRLSLAEPKSLCHCESYLVAEAGGQRAAALCVFKPGDGGWETVGQAQANVQRDLGWTESDAVASELRLAPMYTCFGPDTGADWSIEHVATLPEYRRRGLADALVNEAIQQGAARGCKLAQISILIGNDSAQAAYEKSGFHVHDERRSKEFEDMIGSPGIRRLLRAL